MNSMKVNADRWWKVIISSPEQNEILSSCWEASNRISASDLQHLVLILDPVGITEWQVRSDTLVARVTRGYLTGDYWKIILALLTTESLLVISESKL